jgi:hypothetical protein
MTSKIIKGCDLSLHLAQHAKESEEIDEQDSSLSAIFYIDSQILPIDEHVDIMVAAGHIYLHV